MQVKEVSGDGRLLASLLMHSLDQPASLQIALYYTHFALLHLLLRVLLFGSSGKARLTRWRKLDPPLFGCSFSVVH